MTCRWQFYDLNTLETYLFEVNPNAGGSPQRKKSIATKKTTAPDGRVLMFEGASEPASFEWSGVLLTQTQFDTYVTWYQKRHQILLTDDLGRESYIYITQFQPTRQRASHTPWKHSYTVTASALDWPTYVPPLLSAAARLASGTGAALDSNHLHVAAENAAGVGDAGSMVTVSDVTGIAAIAAGTGAALGATVI